jgi:Domain of unknown function (DUF4440)
MKTRRTRILVVLISIAATMSAPLFAKDDAREPLLRAAEAARFQAQVDADAKVLAPLLDDRLEYVHSNGELDSKTSFVESLTTGRRDYVSTTFTIESLRIFGDVAVIRGKAKVTVADNGQSKDLSLGYTDVWIWKDKRWQMTAWRSMRMPDSPVK